MYDVISALYPDSYDILLGKYETGQGGDGDYGEGKKNLDLVLRWRFSRYMLQNR